MVCNICGKNEATIHLTEILNNQMVEIHLCEPCAEQKGTDFNTHFNFNQLLANLTETTVKKADRAARLTCKVCGMTYEEFSQIGRFGCAHCYQTFERFIMPILKRVQRELMHVGKIPVKSPEKVKKSAGLRDLHERLRHAIQSEAYEEAAKIRDEIRKFEESEKKEPKKPKS